MNENTNFVSRRSALRGIAGFAGASAVGVGALSHASEPAAAQVDNAIEIDDITIQLAAPEGEPMSLTEFGFSDLWFEVQWENIEHGLNASFRIRTNTGGFATLSSMNLGVDGEGTETFGYGSTYESSYDVDIGGLSNPDTGTDVEVPMRFVSGDQGDFILDHYGLDDDQSLRTVPAALVIGLRETDEAGEPIPPVDDLVGNDSSTGFDEGALSWSSSTFGLTVQRVEPGAEASDGEADAYGDG